jgi:hypothetical protein
MGSSLAARRAGKKPKPRPIARALGDRDQHDVHDADAADEQAGFACSWD